MRKKLCYHTPAAVIDTLHSSLMHEHEKGEYVQHSSNRSLPLPPPALPRLSALCLSIIGHVEVRWCLPQVLIGQYSRGGMASRCGFALSCCQPGDQQKLQRGSVEMGEESCEVMTPPPEHSGTPTDWQYSESSRRCREKQFEVKVHWFDLYMWTHYYGAFVLFCMHCRFTTKKTKMFYFHMQSARSIPQK